MPYKNILWIKLEKRLLNDYRFYTLSEESQLIYLKLLMLSAETNNKIPKKLEILSACLRCKLLPKKLSECIEEIKINFPKFTEKPEWYCFREWEYRHNLTFPRSSKGIPKELPRSSKGITDKIRLDKIRLDKIIHTQPQKIEVVDENSINQIFDMFYKSVNPMINFGNKTSRDSAQFLINKLGAEKAIKLAKYACSIQGKEFAPTISTPYQLKEKFASLGVYSKRKTVNQNTTI